MEKRRLKGTLSVVASLITILGAIYGVLTAIYGDRDPFGLRGHIGISPTRKDAKAVAPEKSAVKKEPTLQEAHIAVASPSSRLVSSTNWQHVFAQVLSDVERHSSWRSDPALSSFLKEGKVEVVFTESRLNEAAHIVYRLRKAGANVTPRFVDIKTGTAKHSGLFYHWNRLQMAQAIQAIVQDIESLELRRNDQSGGVAVWITGGAT